MAHISYDALEDGETITHTSLNTLFGKFATASAALDYSNFREEGLDARPLEDSVQGELIGYVGVDTQTNTAGAFDYQAYDPLNLVSADLAAGSVDHTDPITFHSATASDLKMTSGTGGMGLGSVVIPPSSVLRIRARVMFSPYLRSIDTEASGTTGVYPGISGHYLDDKVSDSPNARDSIVIKVVVLKKLAAGGAESDVASRIIGECMRPNHTLATYGGRPGTHGHVGLLTWIENVHPTNTITLDWVRLDLRDSNNLASGAVAPNGFYSLTASSLSLTLFRRVT